jgi:hypothetical protein
VPAGFNYNAGVAKFVGEQVFPKSDNNVVINGFPVIGFASTAIANGVMSYGYSSPNKTFATMTVTSGS